MLGYKYWLALLAFGLLAGCSTTPPKQENSGFLSHYGRLEPLETQKNERYFGYGASDRVFGHYDRIYIEPVILHVSEGIRQSWDAEAQQPHTLKEHLTQKTLREHFTQRLQEGMGHSLELADEPGPNTLTLRVAITGVDEKFQPLKPYQVFPWSLLIVGVTEATGLRRKMINIYQEGELVDSVTGQQVAALVGGLQLGPVNIRTVQKMEPDELKGLVDSWIDAFCRNLPKCQII